MAKRKRILLCASYSVIEPLGLLHLAGLARDMGWERRIHLVPNHDFETFFEKILDFKPDVVGFSIYTGAHQQLFEAYQRLEKDCPGIVTVIGGPHATYFPTECAEFSDFVVMSEGFGRLREILKGEAAKGILPMKSIERFPHPDRTTFYQDYPEHAASPIKSFISMTGCPYKCTYCYNSSNPSDIAAPQQIIKQVESGLALTVLGQKRSSMGSGRLFPHNVRSVDDVIAEASEIAERWPTKVLYCQDDVHGFDTKPGGVLDQIADQWPTKVGLPYHAQMRWEMTSGESGDRRLDVLREAGCFGLTLAIESADEAIRHEVLDRGMKEEMMFDGMRKLVDRDYRVRTEQIMGLPYGATTRPTRMNLEADLELVELNVRLRDETGGPTMAWASTLAPYAGTKLGEYCRKYGHYENLHNHDVPDTFFERSVLRFPKHWVGPDLTNLKRDESVWLSPEDLEAYRNKNAELRRHFYLFCLVPKGHELAVSYLDSDSFSYERLGQETQRHLLRLAELGDNEASEFCNQIDLVQLAIENFDEQAQQLKDDLKKIAPYVACLPKPSHFLEKIASTNGPGELMRATLSRTVRHHLYDNVLYAVESSDTAEKPEHCRPQVTERYPAKL